MAEATPDGYANALRREILRSEVQRMRVLAIVLAVLLAATLIAANFFPDFTRRMFRGGIAGWDAAGRHRPVRRSTNWWRCSSCAGGLAQDKDFPRIARFANALIETSLPSVIIFVLSHHMDAADGVRLLAADALFRVHPAVDAAARFLAVAVDRRRRGRAAAGAGRLAAADRAVLRRAGADADLSISAAASCCWRAASSPASWPAACAGSSRRRWRRRRRATASPTCSASTSRPPWSTGCSPR